MEATLIYPHQLFAEHPSVQKGRAIYLIEDPLFFGNDPQWPCAMHQQKLLLHRASMKAYQRELQAREHEVIYVDCPCAEPVRSDVLLGKILPRSVKNLHLADPHDDVLMRRLQKWARRNKANLQISPSPNFLSPPDFLEQQLAGRKKPFMARFYEAQRKRMKVLVDEDDGPLGGRWSFDEENRKKLPAKHQVVREPWCANADLTEARAYVQRNFSHHLGTMDGFRWPVTRADSQRWLVQFVNERLDEFGIYEDAIAVKHAFLYHSAITPMLNIGLLDPRDVVAAVLARQNEVPMNSLEGFVRQVIGWREFMAGIYRFHGRAIRVRNFWGFTRPMPLCFYDGTSGIGPVDRVIRQVLAEGYCHHIERLMVLGNFFLLCRIRPDDVYRWFMEMFVDAYDWVMVPNVYGMSQFADGGTFTTKPYLSGSNYVKKMSDEPSGDWCAVWDGLFWIFIADHREFFLKNPRLSMMVRTWDKQSLDKQVAHREVAEAFLARLDA